MRVFAMARKCMISVGVAAATFAMVAALLPVSAGATIFERFDYEFTDSFVSPLSALCGFEVQVDTEARGRVIIREGKGKAESAFFAHDQYWYTDIYSANGKFFTISGHSLFKETKATPLGGSLFEFRAMEAGQPFVVRDMNGDVLVRDRGLLSSTIVFDTLGDDVPGGIFIEELDFRVAGPHPGLDADPANACSLLAPDPV